MKPVIAEKTKSYNPRILNRVAATNLIKEGDRVVGAMGFGIRDGKFYVIKAKATVVSTGVQQVSIARQPTTVPPRIIRCGCVPLM